MDDKKIKPFLKWAGGKTQLLSEIDSRLPDEEFNYIEPFVGGGSVFLHLAERNNVKSIVINDINRWIMSVYLAIKYHPEELILRLWMLVVRYIHYDEEKQKEYYLYIRKCFNSLIKSDEIVKYNFKDDAVESRVLTIHLAPYFIFLNKTCFNGLYRENSKGEFNVPYGGYKTTDFIDYDNIRRVSRVLQNVKLYNLPFDKFIDTISIDKNTVVYLDPPYRPLNSTSNFNSYDKSGFNDDDQRNLKAYCDKINEKGGKFILSNSDCPDGFFDELYSEYTIERVQARRNINANGNGRGKINELMITNYVR